jgi:molybdenum cofactor synthesis domain-containing protein
MSRPSVALTAAVMTIGDEVVEGRISNANAVWITESLMRRGIWPRLVVAVPDDEELIVRQLRIAADSADIMVVAGGLGWTPDDVTRKSVAEAFYRDLEVNLELARELQATRSWASPAISEASSTFPAGAVPLPSPAGGVPGFVLRRTYVLPGAPDEMRAMFDSIDFAAEARPIHQRSTRWLVTEDRITDLLVEFAARHPAVRLGSYPGPDRDRPYLTLTLTSRDRSALDAAARWLNRRLKGRHGVARGEAPGRRVQRGLS